MARETLDLATTDVKGLALKVIVCDEKYADILDTPTHLHVPCCAGNPIVMRAGLPRIRLTYPKS